MGRRAGWIAVGAVAFATLAAAAPDDVAAFLAGTTKSCIECDLSGQKLVDRDLKRSKLDRAILKNADLSAASLFRSSLQRADLSGVGAAISSFKDALLFHAGKRRRLARCSRFSIVARSCPSTGPTYLRPRLSNTEVG